MLFKPKKKKDAVIQHLKIPIPMLNDIRFADMTETQIASVLCPPFNSQLDNEKILMEKPTSIANVTNKDDQASKEVLKETAPLGIPSVETEHNINHNDNIIPSSHCVWEPSSRLNDSTIGFTSTDATNEHVVQSSSKRTNCFDTTTQPGLSFPNTSSCFSRFVVNMSNTTELQSALELIKSQIQKMALNEDLLDLKRTVDRMQQERVSDLQEHLSRLEEQKKRENEIMEQINATRERLEMAIADRLLEKEEENQSRPTSPKRTSKPTHNEPPDSKPNHRHRHSYRQQNHRQRPFSSYGDVNLASHSRSRHSYHDTQHEPLDFSPYFPDLGHLTLDDFMPPPPPPPPHHRAYFHLNQQHDQSPYFSFDELSRRRSMMPFDMFMDLPLPHHHPFAPPPPFAMRPPSPSRGRRNRKRSKSTDTSFYTSNNYREAPSVYASAEELPPTPYSRSRKSSLRSAKSDLSHDAIPSTEQPESATLDQPIGVELHDNPVPFDLTNDHEENNNPTEENKKQHRFSFPRMNQTSNKVKSGHAQWKTSRSSRHEPEEPGSRPSSHYLPLEGFSNNRVMEENDCMMTTMMAAATTPSMNSTYNIYHASLPPYLAERNMPYQSRRKNHSPMMSDKLYPETQVKDQASRSNYSQNYGGMSHNPMIQGKAPYNQQFIEPAHPLQPYFSNQRERPPQSNYNSLYPTDRIYM
ncbi:hypothetical protein BD560DRAFT_390314 [Blakeslea trispora]|nr:hypothetical protein BD560DRAFT_390314 [Blakeslea trispora]